MSTRLETARLVIRTIEPRDAEPWVAMPGNIGSWRVMEKAGMRYQGLADYFGLEGLKKYVAETAWWQPPELDG